MSFSPFCRWGWASSCWPPWAGLLATSWLDFTWKIRKSLSSNPNKHHLELSFTVQKWRWLPRATLRSRFNCPIIARVLPANILVNWKNIFFAIFGLLEMDKREIYWRTLFGLEDPFVQVHSLLIGLCSCCNPSARYFERHTHFLLSHISMIITFGWKPAAICMFNKNITLIPYSKLFFLLVWDFKIICFPISTINAVYPGWSL